MNIAIIKYSAGNVYSVKTALNRMNIEPVVTDNPEKIKSADKVIFPGVGEASTAMEYLKNKNLDELIPELNQPFLGICLGLQLMCDYSEENNTQGLEIFPVEVKYFKTALKVPHMGWNNFNNLDGELFDGINETNYVYFVHSYYAELSDYTIAETQYGETKFSAALHKNNYFATQFHPEKSGPIGEKIFANFIQL